MPAELVSGVIYQCSTEPSTVKHPLSENQRWLCLRSAFDTKQPGCQSGVCCPELAVQPAGVLCWFKTQVVWPGNESCLYGAGGAQRDAQWIGQMVKTGPAEQCIRQTQPFPRQGPRHSLTLQPQWATHKRGVRGWLVELQWMHTWTREEYYYIEDKNTIEDSKVHCKQTNNCGLEVNK